MAIFNTPLGMGVRFEDNPLLVSPFVQGTEFGSITPPIGSDFIITEGGADILTEGGDFIVTE